MKEIHCSLHDFQVIKYICSVQFLHFNYSISVYSNREDGGEKRIKFLEKKKGLKKKETIYIFQCRETKSVMLKDLIKCFGRRGIRFIVLICTIKGGMQS